MTDEQTRMITAFRKTLVILSKNGITDGASKVAFFTYAISSILSASAVKGKDGVLRKRAFKEISRTMKINKAAKYDKKKED